ncbi:MULTISPECIES: N-formylglutamate deformylase [unclassified Sulfitobacter]|uniref:N-formylglutamate deformylase n=3 Tax=Sulfitobacter TaxID=60136 RepID=UPI0007C2C7DD|nr:MULTISPECIES: N-formylglutamate deformylase [unclassified Sulfitobacter]KZX93768.1 N-formylglutamate deformylase [Sulfitobacter sp. HI0023]KZZ70101.1 N-formylglutamate deformylase [Sulfitobacter sp. HI0129]
MTPVEVTRGDGPIVLGMPHTGTDLPPEVHAALNQRGRALADTDWHIDRLYQGLLDGATTVRATFHRYVIDANRDPSGQTLYPGQNTTGLIPLTDFDDNAIWETPPSPADTETRLKSFHAPYHAALEEELDRVRKKHGIAILYDCHSIRSEIPFLFDGTLPDFNIGTNDGRTCARALETAAYGLCRAEDGYTSVLNGRFKGGWTTRHYGRPAKGVHAIQMELAQSAYLNAEAPPWEYDPAKAQRLRRPLARLLGKLAHIALDGDLK